MKFTHNHHPECNKGLIIGIIWTVTEAYESHRLLVDLGRQSGMVKIWLFLSICILILPFVIINNEDLLIIRHVWFSTFMHTFLVKTIGIISYCWTLMPLLISHCCLFTLMLFSYSRRVVRPSVSQSVSQSVRTSRIRVRPITLLFEVGFPNCFTEMITIVQGCVARNIWVSTLKVKVTAWPWSKIVSGPYFCYLKSDFQTVSQKWSP